MVWSLHRTWLPRSKPVGAALKIRPSAILRGHTSNVRPLHWNSEVPWLLLSGSWDGTVRAWDVRKAGIGLHSRNNSSNNNKDKPCRREYNKSDKAQAAAGFAEQEEAGRRACIAVMSDHVADVYGLSTSSSRPFCYASVSRDTTIRVFNLEGVVSSIKARSIVNVSLSSSLADVVDSMLPDAPAALCGTASRLLETHLRDLRCSGGTSSVAAFRTLFDFFWGSDGIETFWEVIRWVDAATAASAVATTRASIPASGDDSVARQRGQGSLGWEQQQRRLSRIGGSTWAATGTGGDRLTEFLKEVPRGLMCVDERVVHRDARRASDGALARRLSNSRTFVVQDRRLGKTDRLERAFRLHLAAGDLRSSCEALIALGKWQTALSLAPGVGMEYWRAVSDRYVEVLLGGAQARDCCVESTGDNNGGQAGSDVTALAAALLSSTGRPIEAIRDVLTGSDECLSLAVAVADGAYPPRAPLETLSQDVSKQSAGVAKPVSEEKETSRRRMGEEERSATERATVRGRAEDGGYGGAKLLALIDDHTEEGNAPEGSGTTVVSGVAGNLSPIESSESKGDATSTSPTHLLTRRPDLHQSTAWAEPQPATAAAAQRGHGEAMLHSITKSKAEAFFQASQPALAAAAMLSICDGSRATAAPALGYLIRGDEPELAYAAATALKFPAREVSPLVREMARRAEAWGDCNLSAELLLNAVGEDEISNSVELERVTDDSSIDGNSISRRDRHHPVAAADSGYWSPDVYGACGEEAGPRGAAMVVTRTTTSSWKDGNNSSVTNRANPCPSFSLRSRSSYLEDAAAAVHRGKSVEVVRLLVLGDDLEQASERGVSFLRENVPALSSFPPPPVNKSALAVVRALGSGSDGGLNRVSPRLRMEVLAYASYLGAIQAIVRGYNPVVSPLLRNASSCIAATERIVSGKQVRGGSNTDADEKNSDKGSGPRAGEHSRSPSPGRRRGSARVSGRAASPGRRRGIARPRGRSTSPSGRSTSPSGRSTSPRVAKSSVFPSCMSAAALSLAAIQHLTTWSKEREDARTFSSRSSSTGASTTAAGCSQYGLEAELGYNRRVQDEEKIRPGKDHKISDGLLSSTEHGDGSVSIATTTSPRTSTDATANLTSEAKHKCETNDKSDSIAGTDDDEMASARGLSSEEKGDATSTTWADGRRRRRRSDWVSGNTNGNRSSQFSPWRTMRGEIVVGGSRLSSCRRHERVAWRTTPPRDASSDSMLNFPSLTRVAQPLATSILDSGLEMWPRPRGPAFLLEDEETVLGLNEAVMWSKVNPFSPLNTGCGMTPY